MSVNVSHVTRIFLNLCYYVMWMPSMQEQMPKRVYFTFFYYWGKYYDIIKIFQNSFVLIFWLFPSMLSSICQFSNIYSWICVYFFTCFRRIREVYQRLLSKHNIFQAGVFHFRKWTQRGKFCKHNRGEWDAFCRGQRWTRWYQETWEKLL